MIKPRWCLLILILYTMVLINGACTNDVKPQGTLTIAELLDDPVYDTQVKIYGEVKALCELACYCFFVSSGGESVQVWYDTMVENDGTVRPVVSVERIKNGDRIIVLGELKGEGGIHYRKNVFWARAIYEEGLKIY